MAFKRIWHQAEVLAALAAGATVVTPGERLARAVRLVHGEAHQAASAAVWERPQVSSYSTFLNHLYDEAMALALVSDHAPPPKRFAEAAAEVVWEQAIRTSAVGEGLLQPASAAREAHKAWGLCIAYRVLLEQIAADGDLDAQAFAAWTAYFRSRSREQGWLEDARLVDWLATRLRDKTLSAPAAILFVGFDETTPQQRELMESLRACGSKVQLLQMDAPGPSVASRTLCDDPTAEMRAASAWARALLDQDPTTRIAIVARELADCRAALSRELDDALCPAASVGAALTPAYDLSLGLPLAEAPVVHAGLAVLGLLRRRHAFELASLLLRTPFLGAAESERDARAKLELKLRERMSETLSVQNLTDFATTGGMPQLVHILQTATRIAGEQPARQALSAWGKVFSRLLTESGWPGERALDSREYQAVTAFKDLVGDLTHLDLALGPADMGEALSRLKRQAEESLFQPAAEDAPVQVLGLLETSGLAFEHLWLLGLSDDIWPESPRPGAFIPLRLQREYGLPHGSAAVELDFAQRLTARLMASAGQVVVSTARKRADEELRPSPLITHLPHAELDTLVQSQAPTYRRSLQAEYPRAAERYSDMRGPALKPGERAAGGIGLIRSQAACPFQAFGRYRLGARPLGEPSLGPDAAERGRLVHEVLQALWGEIEDHATLAAMDGATRTALAQRCVSEALARRHRESPDVYTRRVVELEQQRLSTLMHAWLERDAARPPFRVVEREAWHKVRLGPLTLDTRVDRMDELPEGGRVIFDYKTGDAKLKSWLDARPDEPQLPVYATAAGAQLVGLAFASLKPGKMGYLGLAEREGIAEGVIAYAGYKRQPPGVTDWPGLLRFWQENLEALAEEYAAGEARVAPKNQQTCDRCHLAMLCRIHELDGEPADMEGDGDDA